MKDLKRQASSPAESFLSKDVAKLRQFEFSDLLVRKAGGSTDCETCFKRHVKHRLETGIGFEKPLTRWKRGGTCMGPDHWDMTYVRAQPERVWDLLDICHLKKAKEGFDDCYKSYVSPHDAGF